VKLTLQFARPLWPESGDWTFLHTPESPFAIWWRLADPSVAGLVGWCAGPAVLKLTGRSPVELLEIGLAALSGPFGMSAETIERELTESNLADWGNDPFSRGGYAYVPAGGVDLPSQLGRNVEQTLFFAGEATHPLLTGTVEGAIASGQRAAEEILSSRRSSG
jgi:monoamine oxidase